MGLDKSILVSVDDSDESIRVVQYVADIVGAREGFRIRLFHVLPPLPPELLEFGGAESPQRERSLDREHGQHTRRMAGGGAGSYATCL